MDTTPRRRGRPPVTEQARADLRLKISRAAVRLFRENGVAHTTVTEIAAAAGISQRTFWRYFTTKEDCIRPVVGQGLAALGALLDAWPPGTRLVDHALRHAVAHRETPLADPGMVDVVKLVENQHELSAAWFGVHVEAEALFAARIGAHLDDHPQSLRTRVSAALLNGALRAAMEYAVREKGDALDDQDLTDAFRAALTELPF